MRRLTYAVVLISVCLLAPACKKHLDCKQIGEINTAIEEDSRELEAAIKDGKKNEAKQHYEAVERGYKKLSKIDEVTCGSKVYKGSVEKERGEQYLKSKRDDIDKLPQ
jgi:hypothetical protein